MSLPARGKHLGTRTWHIPSWAGKEVHGPERLLPGSPRARTAPGPGSGSLENPAAILETPKALLNPPPVPETHPYFSFFVLNSPVIWFPKYRRGRGNVWKEAG